MSQEPDEQESGGDGPGEGDRAARAADRAEAARADTEALADMAGESAEQAAESAESADSMADADPVVDEAARHREAGVEEDKPFGTLGRPIRRSPFLIGFEFALGAIAAYVLYRSLATVGSVLLLIVVAAFLAIGLHPAVSRLERFGMSRGIATSVVFLLVIGFFVVFVWSIVPPVAHQVTALVGAAPDYLDNLKNNRSLRPLNARFGLVDRLSAAAKGIDMTKIGPQAFGGVLGVGKVVLSGVFNTLTVLILTLYFLSAFDRIKNGAYRLVPRHRRARTVLFGDEILGRVGGYVGGAVVIAVIAGVTSLIWLSAVGVPYPLALALLIAITDLIPLVGATIGAVLVTIVAFFVSLPVGIATLIFFTVYQQVENYLIYPRVMKKSVDVSPAAAIVSVLIGGALLGGVGALLAIPMSAAAQLIFREIILPRQDGA
ncbi:MAG: AI-2E family transporter [Mycobacteriales bacterium]